MITVELDYREKDIILSALKAESKQVYEAKKNSSTMLVQDGLQSLQFEIDTLISKLETAGQ